MRKKSFYNNSDLQEMLEYLKDSSKRAIFLKNLSCSNADRLAIEDCIEEGYYERFDRYDSDVCEIFIHTIEFAFMNERKEK